MDIYSYILKPIVKVELKNNLDKITQKLFELKPGHNRTVRIKYSQPNSDKVRSYYVKLVKTTMPPEPSVAGNEKIKILKHTFLNAHDEDDIPLPAGVEISIRNISDLTVATAEFVAAFLDIEGNVLETIKHKEINLKSGYSRAVLISSSIQEERKVKSYNITINRATTADVEKVQLRKQQMRADQTGGEEITGTAINISDTKTDAAIVATFFNPDEENIGTKVTVLKDIEPGAIRSFNFLFTPQEGDKVRNCTLQVAYVIEQASSA